MANNGTRCAGCDLVTQLYVQCMYLSDSYIAQFVYAAWIMKGVRQKLSVIGFDN